MINRYQDSPEVLKGCLWALATTTTFVLFILITWLGIQRGEIVAARHNRTVAERERDTLRVEKDREIQSLEKRLTQSGTALTAAETQARESLVAKNQAEMQRDQAERELATARAALSATSRVSFPRGTNR